MLIINCLYDPSTGTFGSIPDSVTVANGTPETIQVNLSLVSGAAGNIAFDDPPFTWGINGFPGTGLTPPNGGSTQETFSITSTEPNPTTFGFLINFIYTPPSGSQISGSGDPTIILDGTGG